MGGPESVGKGESIERWWEWAGHLQCWSESQTHCHLQTTWSLSPWSQTWGSSRMIACTAQIYRQTDRQTDRQTYSYDTKQLRGNNTVLNRLRSDWNNDFNTYSHPSPPFTAALLTRMSVALHPRRCSMLHGQQSTTHRTHSQLKCSAPIQAHYTSRLIRLLHSTPLTYLWGTPAAQRRGDQTRCHCVPPQPGMGEVPQHQGRTLHLRMRILETAALKAQTRGQKAASHWMMGLSPRTTPSHCK